MLASLPAERRREVNGKQPSQYATDAHVCQDYANASTNVRHLRTITTAAQYIYSTARAVVDVIVCTCNSLEKGEQST